MPIPKSFVPDSFIPDEPSLVPPSMPLGKATSIGPMSMGQKIRGGIEQVTGINIATAIPKIKEDILGLSGPAEVAATVAAYALMPQVSLPLRASGWLKAGVTAYRAGALGTLMGGIEAGKQLSQRALGTNEAPKTAGEAASGIGKTAATNIAFELATPIAGKAISRGYSITKDVVKRVVSGTSGVSTKAIDAAIAGGDKILKHVGLSADDIAERGNEIQQIVKDSKASINDYARAALGNRYDALVKAGETVVQHLVGVKNNIVSLGQELQSLIPTIKEKAGAEYQAIVKKVLAKNSRYKNITLDFRNGLADTIKQVRDDFGYGNPTRTPDPIGQKAFQNYVNRIVGLDKASIEDAFYLQKDLGNAVYRNRGTETAAALRKLRDGVFDVMGSIPEVKNANTTYKTGMALLDDMSGMQNADNLSKTVIRTFNEGGNKMDALMRFAGADPKANNILKSIITHADDYAAIEDRGKVIGKMAQGIEKVKDTYSIGDVEKTMINLSQRDPVVKKLLAETKDKTEMFNRLSSLINGDKSYKQIIDVMGASGNRKDALTKLSKEIPGLSQKISILQDAVLGREFNPMMRNLPQTGMGFGVLSVLSSPKWIALSPLFSPRFTGVAASAIGKVSRATGEIPMDAISPIGKAAAFSLIRDKD